MAKERIPATVDEMRPRRSISRPGGFTIIEISLVLVITAILAALAVTTYQRLTIKARFTEAQTALRHLQKTETLYFTDHKAYTDNTVLLDFNPTTYTYYEITVTAPDNTPLASDAIDYKGWARGIGAMAGDLWFVTRDMTPQQDPSSTYR